MALGDRAPPIVVAVGALQLPLGILKRCARRPQSRQKVVGLMLFAIGGPRLFHRAEHQPDEQVEDQEAHDDGVADEEEDRPLRTSCPI
jgi:hypothetical protein